MKEYPNNFVIINRLPHEACIQQQKAATLLLNFILGAQSNGLIGAKTYELISMKKPILVLPCNKETNPPLFPNANIQTFAYSAQEVEDYLTYYFNLFLNKEDFKINLSDKNLFEISRENQAIKLGNHLRLMIN